MNRIGRVLVDPPLALAPMAVLPELQHLGVGSELVWRGLDVCREQGRRIVVVLGHPAFYPRFGFSPALAARLTSPFGGGEAFMAAELVPGALDGVVRGLLRRPVVASGTDVERG